MKLKLFTASMLLSLVLAACAPTPSQSESDSKKEESSKTPDSSLSVASSSSPKAESSKKSSSSVPDIAPEFADYTDTTNAAPVEASPLDAEGKFPATHQVPKEAMSQEFLRLFAYNSKPQIFLNFSKSSLKAMSDLQHDRNNRKLYDVYFPANFRLILDGKHYDFDEVGVRLKGNWSRKELVDWSGTNIVKISHLKISFKQTFDDEILYNLPETKAFKHDWSNDAAGRATRKKRTLFGMEKIDLKYTPRNDSQGTGNAQNACIGREVYCYDRFREEELLAPYSNLGKVTLNNGVSNRTETMQIVECVDKAFLTKRYSSSDAKGNLYKCAKNLAGTRANFKPDNSIDSNPQLDSDGFEKGVRKANGNIGVEDCYNGYDPVYQLKTNDDLGEGADYSDLATLISKLHSIVTFSTITSAKKLSALNSMIDMDNFLKFSAVSYLLGNVDDQRNAGNNFYLYFLPSTKKVSFIAYDWDWSLGSAYDSKDMLNVNPLDTYVPEGGNENKDIGASGGGNTGGWGGGQTTTPDTFSTDDKSYTGYENNLFWSTILTPRSPRCDVASMGYASDLQHTYLEYVNDLKDSVLNPTYFNTEITTKFKTVDSTLALDSEKTKVTAFMSGRKTNLGKYFTAHPLNS